MTTRAIVSVWNGVEELAQAAADKMSRLMRQAIEERGMCSLVLAGGETPRRVYQKLAGAAHSGLVDWGRVQVFFGDERMVPAGHADSNFGMAERELLSRVPVPVEHIHRMQGERSAVDAATLYEQELADVFGEPVPRFDLITLGVGEDGHTASLFPHTPSVLEVKQRVLGYFVPQLNSSRVTLTLPVLLNARSILFFAAGRRKAEIIRRVLSAVTPTADLPASMVLPHNGALEWMLDAEAAALAPGVRTDA